MKTKTKILLSAILAVAFCVSMIAGATMAIFTSNDSVNIAVNSGKVNVNATVAVKDVYSPTSIGTDGVVANGADSATYNDGSKYYFKHSDSTTAASADLTSYAEITGTDTQTVTLKNIAPGDKVELNLTLSSDGTVTYKWRLSLKNADSAESELFKQLILGVKDNTTTSTYEYYTSYYTNWETVTPAANSTTAATINEKVVSIELPGYVGNAAQEKSCNLQLLVEAVQGNTDAKNTATSSKVWRVASQSELTTAVGSATSGDTIILDQKATENDVYENPWTTAEINYEAEKTLYIRGYDIGTLNVNAPNGTIYMDNNVKTIGTIIVANESLHLYGTIGTLNIRQGHVVLEQGSSVIGTATITAAENKTASLEIAKEVAVENISADSTNGIVQVANKGVVEKLTSTGDNTTIKNVTYGDDNNNKGVIKDSGSSLIPTVDGNGIYVAGTASELSAAVATAADGSTIKLTANIDEATIAFDDDRELTFDSYKDGCNFGTLTMNVPLGTVNLKNNATNVTAIGRVIETLPCSLGIYSEPTAYSKDTYTEQGLTGYDGKLILAQLRDGTKVDVRFLPKSFHFYGTIANLEIVKGYAVMEDGSTVTKSFLIAPSSANDIVVLYAKEGYKKGCQIKGSNKNGGAKSQYYAYYAGKNSSSQVDSANSFLFQYISATRYYDETVGYFN